jgi:hypothetical protein
VLAAELRGLEGEGLDLAVVGFSDEELKDLLLEEPEAEDAEEEIPDEPANPVTRAGDVWTIGQDRLACGDCLSPSRIGAVMECESGPTAGPHNLRADSGGDARHPQLARTARRDVKTDLAVDFT